MSLEVHHSKNLNNKFVLFIVPMIINCISLTLVALSQMSTAEAHLLKIGLIILSGGYLLTMVFYLPPLVVLRWIRGQRILYQNIFTCVSILLWSFTPLAITWIILAIITLYGLNISWQIFTFSFFWEKALLLPVSLFLSYWKLSHENIYISFIDSMITSIIVLILFFISF